MKRPAAVFVLMLTLAAGLVLTSTTRAQIGFCLPGQSPCEVCQSNGNCDFQCRIGVQYCATIPYNCNSKGQCMYTCLGSGYCNGYGNGAKGASACKKANVISLRGEALFSTYPWLRYGEEQTDSNGNIASMLAKNTSTIFHQMFRSVTEQFQRGMVADVGYGNSYDPVSKTHYMIEWSIDESTRTTKINFYTDIGKLREYQVFKLTNPEPLETLEITPTNWSWSATKSNKTDSGTIR